MALTTLAVANYRSLRDLVLPLAPLSIVTGANGSGKSALYRALRLLADAAHGRLVASLADEGGLPSTLWAGPERFSAAMRRGEQPVQGTVRRGAVSLRLGFASDDFGYAIDCGLPVDGGSAFALDPMIKRECVWAGPVLRPSALLVDRRGASIRVRSQRVSGAGGARARDDDWRTLPGTIASFDSVVSHGVDPREAPELFDLRERMRRWRFYDQLRSDRDSPARQPRVGTRTVALGDDGADLAAAVQTIREIGDGQAFDDAVADAFPGASVAIDVHDGRFMLRFAQQGLLRPLAASELSDGTLRYLLWVAALLSPRPPELLVMNEPENSLHPDLLPALGRLIGAAAARGQIIVVTHASRLVAALDEVPDRSHLTLTKTLGETVAADVDAPAGWHWPAR